jgi:hypothetical protein
MKKLIQITLIGLTIFTFASCSVTGPLLITDNPGGKESKVGEASYKVILGFIKPMNADASIQKAAKNGGITKVSSVDTKVKGGLFSTTIITVVTGE